MIDSVATRPAGLSGGKIESATQTAYYASRRVQGDNVVLLTPAGGR